MKTSRLLLCWIAAATLAGALPLFAKSAPTIGDLAPAFSGRDQDGHKWKLSRHLGKSIVFLYFYPEDYTSRDTSEAASLRDNLAELRELGVTVVGVSRDRKASHKRFAFSNNLSFALVTDAHGKIADAYGARMRGDEKLDRRMSYLIGLDGRILHITDSPDPALHVREMINTIATLTGNQIP
jgi:peroxiredoxin Q/BCP